MSFLLNFFSFLFLFSFTSVNSSLNNYINYLNDIINSIGINDQINILIPIYPLYFNNELSTSISMIINDDILYTCNNNYNKININDEITFKELIIKLKNNVNNINKLRIHIQILNNEYTNHEYNPTDIIHSILAEIDTIMYNNNDIYIDKLLLPYYYNYFERTKHKDIHLNYIEIEYYFANFNEKR